jgi:hypothetical protein
MTAEQNFLPKSNWAPKNGRYLSHGTSQPRKRPRRKETAMSDSPWRLSDQHQALLRLMLEEPTPKVSTAFKEQLAAYVKGGSHE